MRRIVVLVAVRWLVGINPYICTYAIVTYPMMCQLRIKAERNAQPTKREAELLARLTKMEAVQAEEQKKKELKELVQLETDKLRKKYNGILKKRLRFVRLVAIAIASSRSDSTACLYVVARCISYSIHTS